MELRTRRARTDDLDGVMSVLESALPPNLRGDATDYRIRIEKLGENFIVGELDGEVVGYVSSMIMPDRPTVDELEMLFDSEGVESAADFHQGGNYDGATKCFYLGVIAVKEGRRNNGYGTALLDETKRLARSKSFDRIHLITTKEKEPYFMKRGATAIDDSFTPYFGVPHRWYEMRV